jgi:DNA-binding Lrp family transcriptional regulator
MKQMDKNVTEIMEVMHSDCQLTCRMIADELDMSKETVMNILIWDLV